MKNNTKNLTFGIALCASIDRDKLRWNPKVNYELILDEF